VLDEEEKQAREIYPGVRITKDLEMEKIELEEVSNK
jgi:hypothetical protein